MTTIKKFLSMPANVWIILFGTFLINAAYWMTWPFLAIILHSKYHLSSSMIGAALSFPLAFSTIFGIYLGNIADKVGRSKIMIIGCFLSFCAYIVFAYAEALTPYMITIWLANIGRAILEPASKSIFGDIVINENRASCQQLRYFFVNKPLKKGHFYYKRSIRLYVCVSNRRFMFFLGDSYVFSRNLKNL